MYSFFELVILILFGFTCSFVCAFGVVFGIEFAKSVLHKLSIKKIKYNIKRKGE